LEKKKGTARVRVSRREKKKVSGLLWAMVLPYCKEKKSGR